MYWLQLQYRQYRTAGAWGCWISTILELMKHTPVHAKQQTSDSKESGYSHRQRRASRDVLSRLSHVKRCQAKIQAACLFYLALEVGNTFKLLLHRHILRTGYRYVYYLIASLQASLFALRLNRAYSLGRRNQATRQLC